MHFFRYYKNLDPGLVAEPKAKGGKHSAFVLGKKIEFIKKEDGGFEYQELECGFGRRMMSHAQPITANGLEPAERDAYYRSAIVTSMVSWFLAGSGIPSGIFDIF